MAKGQQRGNKEAKKPKKDKAVIVPPGSFIVPSKGHIPSKPKPEYSLGTNFGGVTRHDFTARNR